MQEKTVTIAIVIMIICGISAFTIFNNNDYVPAITSNNLIDKYTREEGCAILTARELKEKMYFDIADSTIPPVGTPVKSTTFIGAFPQHWKIYEKNDRKSKDLDVISHDPPPDYKQSAQTFTVGVSGPNEDFYLTCIKVHLTYFGAGSGKIYCDLRTLAGREPMFLPSKTNLGVASLYDDGTQASGEYWNFTYSPPILLEGGNSYCFVLRIPGSSLCKSVQYGGSAYPGGYRCRTTDDGKSWIIDEYSDLYDWTIYGYSAVDEKEDIDKPVISSLYHDFADGDCIIIYDAISSIQYYPDDDYTNVCFSWHQTKNTMISSCFRFEGDITDKYGEGDVVEITLHLLHIELETTDNKYNIEIR